MTVSELIERLDKARPSRDLDADIAITLGIIADREWWSINYLTSGMTPCYTASIDAAAALCELVLPGVKISLYVNHLTSAKDGSGARASVYRKKGPKCPHTGIRWPSCQGECFHAPTAALAICIALLKAKVAEDELMPRRRAA
jgi:hypothetical protein